MMQKSRLYEVTYRFYTKIYMTLGKAHIFHFSLIYTEIPLKI